MDNPVTAKYAAAITVAAGLVIGARVAPHPALKAMCLVSGASVGIYAHWQVRQYLVDGARWVYDEANRPGWPQFDTHPSPKKLHVVNPVSPDKEHGDDESRAKSA
jgi:hypothetical protein